MSKEPPNFRESDSCSNCRYKYIRWDKDQKIARCQRYDGVPITRRIVCDDYDKQQEGDGG